jgi:Ca-activated chloride channel family protein
MNDKSFEAKLARVSAPAPDPAARLRAKRAALEEFARGQAANPAGVANAEAGEKSSEAGSKNLWDALRLFRDDSSHGSTSMAWFVRRNLFAGVAGACVVGLGIAMVWPIFHHYGDSRLFEDLQPPPVTVDLKPQAQAPTKPPVPERGRPVAQQAPAEASPQRNDLAKTTPAENASALAKDKARGESDARLQARAQAEAQERHSKANEEFAAGTREKLQASLEAKRETTVDAITAEEIGKFPDQNQAEALQRIPGVTITAGAAAPAPPSPPPANDEMQESVVVTGARASRAAAAPHKGAAAPSGSGSGLFRQKDVASAPPSTFAGAIQPAIIAEPSMSAPDEGRDKFEQFEVSSFKQVAEAPVSTFSADVDTASYSFVRRQLNSGRLPQKDSVRVEEMINYFDYSWPAATSAKAPFKPTVVVSDSPWGKGRKLVHIGIKGYEISRDQSPDANLVLLLDVSGSMSSPDKLPLAVQSMELLLSSLKPTDTVGIVVYAGAAGTVLEPTPVANKQKIISALRELSPGGSTAGAEGIERAYQLAEAHFRKGGVNRILLATDGDFNVGIDSTNELKGFVGRKREKGIYLSVLGFGQGNYRDELAQALAQNGNGVAAYIDTLGEAQKVLVQEAGASLFTIAKDVKLQVEFNPATVAEYRLVGYETRALKREDFNNDAVDAGDVGSGHTVTAIYEITPVGSTARSVDPSRYAKESKEAADSKETSRIVAIGKAQEYGFLKIRYKLPDSNTSDLIEQPILVASRDVPASVQRDVQFSTAVAGFGQLLRGGKFTGTLNYDEIVNQAQASKGDDPFGYRTEFVQLVRKAKVAREM